MPDFVEFSREGNRDRRDEPMFTLQASGLLSFNHAAFIALGEPAAVALLYDADERVVGVRQVEKDHQNAYPVRKQGKSMTYLVSAQGFVAHHEIPRVKARRFLARDFGGVWGFAGMALSLVPRPLRDAGYSGPIELELLGPRIEAEGAVAACRRAADAIEALI